MKKSLIVFCSIIISGCTTLYYPGISGSRSATEQSLMYTAIKTACNNIELSPSKQNIDELKKQLDKYQNDRNELKSKESTYNSINFKIEMDKITNKIEDIRYKLDKIQNIKNISPKIKTGKVYVEIRCNPERGYLYRNLIENSLIDQNIILTINEKEADLKLRIVVIQDGLDNSFTRFLYIYTKQQLNACVSMDISLIDLRTSKILFSDI